MYMSVQRSFAVATGSFMGINLQTTPMSGIKSVIGGDMAGLSLVLLWVVMGALQFLSMKIPQMLQKRRAEQEAAIHHRKPEVSKNNSNMIMQIYMMGMIMVFGFMWPAAMSLYWAINSLVNVVKTIIVQKIIDKKNPVGRR
jgi:YidC/Oxa1 family membrane protein insertase